MLENLKDIEKQFKEELDKVDSNDELEKVRVSFLGKKGLVTNELKNAIDNLVIKEVEKAIISDNENIITYNNIQYLKEEHYNYNYVLETIKELNLDSEILFNSQYRKIFEVNEEDEQVSLRHDADVLLVPFGQIDRANVEPQFD